MYRTPTSSTDVRVNTCGVGTLKCMPLTTLATVGKQSVSRCGSIERPRVLYLLSFVVFSALYMRGINMELRPVVLQVEYSAYSRRLSRDLAHDCHVTSIWAYQGPIRAHCRYSAQQQDRTRTTIYPHTRISSHHPKRTSASPGQTAIFCVWQQACIGLPRV